MDDPTWTAIVEAHLDELRSDAEQERLAALARVARRRCPLRAGAERQRDQDRPGVIRVAAATHPPVMSGDRT